MKKLIKWLFTSIFLGIIIGISRFFLLLFKTLFKAIWLTLKLGFRFSLWFLYFSSRVLTKPFRLCFPPKNINQMSGIDFENFVAKWLALGGYRRIKLTKKSSDYGVDILAVKDGVPIGVQCKRYSGRVGVSAIQEICAGLSYYDLEKGIVITNSTFTKNAVNLAVSNGIELVDGEELLNSKAAKTLITSYFTLYFNTTLMSIITFFALILNVWVFFNYRIFMPLTLLFLFICILCLFNSVCEIKDRKDQDLELRNKKKESPEDFESLDISL